MPCSWSERDDGGLCISRMLYTVHAHTHDVIEPMHAMRVDPFFPMICNDKRCFVICRQNHAPPPPSKRRSMSTAVGLPSIPVPHPRVIRFFAIESRLDPWPPPASSKAGLKFDPSASFERVLVARSAGSETSLSGDGRKRSS